MTVRILIAEDEPFILESLTFLLEREGYQLTTVQNGAQVVEAVGQAEPHLIVLDTMLPGKDGFAILADLRAAPDSKGIPVLVLTAKGQQSDRARMMALGANAFVTKPFANRELLAEIARLLAANDAAAGTAGGT